MAVTMRTLLILVTAAFAATSEADQVKAAVVAAEASTRHVIAEALAFPPPPALDDLGPPDKTATLEQAQRAATPWTAGALPANVAPVAPAAPPVVAPAATPPQTGVVSFAPPVPLPVSPAAMSAMGPPADAPPVVPAGAPAAPGVVTPPAAVVPADTGAAPPAVPPRAMADLLRRGGALPATTAGTPFGVRVTRSGSAAGEPTVSDMIRVPGAPVPAVVEQTSVSRPAVTRPGVAPGSRPNVSPATTVTDTRWRAPVGSARQISSSDGKQVYSASNDWASVTTATEFAGDDPTTVYHWDKLNMHGAANEHGSVMTNGANGDYVFQFPGVGSVSGGSGKPVWYQGTNGTTQQNPDGSVTHETPAGVLHVTPDQRVVAWVRGSDGPVFLPTMATAALEGPQPAAAGISNLKNPVVAAQQAVAEAAVAEAQRAMSHRLPVTPGTTVVGKPGGVLSASFRGSL